MDLNSRSELVTRMNAAVRPRESAARGPQQAFSVSTAAMSSSPGRSLAFCLVKHDGGVSVGVFRFHSGNELVADINHVV